MIFITGPWTQAALFSKRRTTMRLPQACLTKSFREMSRRVEFKMPTSFHKRRREDS
jgi:hypothetical protein